MTMDPPLDLPLLTTKVNYLFTVPGDFIPFVILLEDPGPVMRGHVVEPTAV